MRVLNPYYALYVVHSALCYMLQIILYWFKLLLLIDVHVELYNFASVNWKMQQMWCENQGENSRYSDHIFVSWAFFSKMKQWDKINLEVKFFEKKRKRLQIDMSALNVAKDVIFEHWIMMIPKSLFEPYSFSIFSNLSIFFINLFNFIFFSF